jgi:hypothetical protein
MQWARRQRDLGQAQPANSSYVHSPKQRGFPIARSSSSHQAVAHDPWIYLGDLNRSEGNTRTTPRRPPFFWTWRPCLTMAAPALEEAHLAAGAWRAGETKRPLLV